MGIGTKCRGNYYYLFVHECPVNLEFKALCILKDLTELTVIGTEVESKSALFIRYNLRES